MSNTHDLMHGVDTRVVVIENGFWYVNESRYSVRWDGDSIVERQAEMLEAWKDLEAIKRQINSPEYAELIKAFREVYGGRFSMPSQEFIDGYKAAKAAG